MVVVVVVDVPQAFVVKVSSKVDRLLDASVTYILYLYDLLHMSDDKLIVVFFHNTIEALAL